jgi:hypothetical protein
MIKLTNLLKEMSTLVKENTNDVVTNYTKERESEKAAMVVVPYITNKGDEKSLKLWVPKSMLDKNGGIPKWIISNHLKDLAKKGINYDINNIMTTIGKSSADLPQPAKLEYVEAWDFMVDPSVVPHPSESGKKSNARAATKMIQYTKVYDEPMNPKSKFKTTYHTQEEAQRVIDMLIRNYKIDKMQLLVWKKKVTKDEADKMLDPYSFMNTTTKQIKEKDLLGFI